jgi:SH3 domain-containing YSC84-like protein 1
MNGNGKLLLMPLTVLTLLTLLTFVACSSARTERSTADSSMSTNERNTHQLVEKSDMTLQTFMATPELQAFRDLLKKAQGIYIAPQVLEGAFIWGASGGSGIFMARTARADEWSPPAFYTMGEASFGLQAGGKAAQVIMLTMTDRGVNAFKATSFKLGADVSVAAGPIGGGVDASTANLSADILTFSLAKGLYGGISLQGAVMAVRNAWNEAYYHQAAITPSDILVGHVPDVPRTARNIIHDLSRASMMAAR